MRNTYDLAWILHKKKLEKLGGGSGLSLSCQFVSYIFPIYFVLCVSYFLTIFSRFFSNFLEVFEHFPYFGDLGFVPEKSDEK